MTTAPPERPAQTDQQGPLDDVVAAGNAGASGRRPKGGRPRRLRRAVVIVAAVAVVAAAGGAYALSRRDQPASGATQTRTVPVSLTTMQQTVSSTGTLEPANRADLSFGASGTVQTLDATVGQKVTKGQRLATIDDTTLRSQVDLAHAQVDQAQTQVNDSSTGTTAQIASANAQLAAANAKLTSAEEALTGATLTAPFDGVIASVNTQLGDRVTGSSSGSGGSGGTGGSGATGGNGNTSGNGSNAQSSSSSAAITVISTDSWIVSASVTNADLPNVRAGMQAQISLTGAQKPVFGTVQSVGIVASSSSSGVAEFPVTIAVTGKPAGLYAGTSVSVSIIVKQLNDVLVVPTIAVRTENGQTVVSVQRNGATVTTPVTVGQVFGPQTQVTKGLSEGDVVVIDLSSFQRGTGTGGNGTGTGTNGQRGTGARTGTFGGGGFGGGGFGGGGFGGGGFGGGGLGGGQGR